MRFQGFIGPSYTLSSVDVDCQRCVNLYPEIDENKTGKDQEIASLIGTPGLALLSTIGSGPIRGAWLTSTGVLYVVSGATLYQVSSAWAGTSVGTLLTTTGQVSMSDNGLQLVIVDGPNGYSVTLATNVFAQIVDPNWQGSNLVTYQDLRFVFVKPGTNVSYVSDQLAVSITPLSQVSKEGFPDNIISFISANRNLWFFGDQSTEVWFDAGNTPNPFQFIEGTLMQYGCAAAFSVAKMANTVFWLGKDHSGQGMVFLANGYQPQRISTQAVELAIQKYSKISDAIGFTYQQNGHQFYVLSFPSGNATWVYDTMTNLWHERAYYNNGALERHRANCFAFAYGLPVVGDYSNGNLYQLSLGTYSDNGSPLVRLRTSPHISQDMVRIFHSQFQLDIESGTGLDGTGQGTSPQAMLEWSNDGGHSWSSQIWSSFGAIGQTRSRAIWRKLGRARNRVYRVTISDPVKVNLIGAEIEVIKGAS